MAKKVLFLLQLPPPVHGSAVLSKFVFDAPQIRTQTDAKFIDISSEKQLKTIGKFGFTKMLRAMITMVKVLVTQVRFKPDLTYYTLTPTGYAFARDSVLILLLKLLGGRLIIHLHCKGLTDAASGKYRTQYYRAVFKHCDVILGDEKLRADLLSVADPQRAIYYAANGCEDHSAEVEPTASEKLRVLYLSNFIPTKGAAILVKAVNLLSAEEASKLEVSLAGGVSDGEYFNSLIRLAKQKHSGTISILEPQYGDAKNRLLKNADIFVLPTSYPNECFPVSILEAMSHSTAVLSSDEGAVSSIVDEDQNGFVLPADSPEAFAEKIRLYMAEPERLRRHQQNARKKYVENYQVEQYQARVLEALTKSLNNAQRQN